MTDARVGRIAVKVLAKPSPDARVGRLAVKVLVKRNGIVTVGGGFPLVKKPDGTWQVISLNHTP